MMAKKRTNAARARRSPRGKDRRGGLKYIEYESSRGRVARFTAMPPMLMSRIETQVEEEFGDVSPPTYEVETVTGRTQVVEHTAKTVTSGEGKAAWNEYVRLNSERNEAKSSKVMRALQMECLQPIIPEDEEEGGENDWVARHKFSDLAVPDNKFERKLYWIEAEFVGNSDDMMACLKIPMELAGVSGEDMAAAENLFQDSIPEEIA